MTVSYAKHRRFGDIIRSYLASMLLHVYLHHESQLRLQSQVCLLAPKQLVFRMRICIVCIRRAAHISANGYANGYRYGYGYGYGYRGQVFIYTGLLVSRDQSNKSFKHPNNTCG